MPSTPVSAFPADRELVLQRVLNAPREKLWRCWTTPALIVQWFTPPPWKTVKAVMDVRAGGSSNITMQSPEGQEFRKIAREKGLKAAIRWRDEQFK